MDEHVDKLVAEVAAKHGVDAELVRRLVDYERPRVHLERRRGAKDELRRAIEKHIEERAQ